MRARSPRSAGATYLDKPKRIADLREAARRAAGRVPEIRRVILFGSLVSGTPTPRSDADLLVEVATSPHDNPRDRIPDVLRALSPLPCPVDLFVFTTEEVETMRGDNAPLGRVAFETGIDLLAT